MMLRTSKTEYVNTEDLIKSSNIFQYKRISMINLIDTIVSG